jgi:hypothetical protein
MPSTVPYEFPASDRKEWWEKRVRQAISRGSLKWTHVIENQWTLSGKCPRCKHSMSDYMDLSVIVAETLTGTSFGPRGAAEPRKAATFRTEVICNCDVISPHRKETKGCGYGKDLEIELLIPSKEGD